jgi:hypothetical protein
MKWSLRRAGSQAKPAPGFHPNQEGCVRFCTVVALGTAGVRIENTVSDVRVGTDAGGTPVDGDATTSVTITNSFVGVLPQPEVVHQFEGPGRALGPRAGSPRSADDQPGHQGEEQRRTQLHQRVARRDAGQSMDPTTEPALPW